MNIDETRWMLRHFDDDALETESVRLTVEILKTAVVVLFGLLVYGVMA